MMTQKRFFEIARRVKWEVRLTWGSNVVRKARGRLCPLAYVTKQVVGKAHWSPINTPDLPSWDFQQRVMTAADSLKGRTWLMRNLGLAK